jgi:hypothetical protein
MSSPVGALRLEIGRWHRKGGGVRPVNRLVGNYKRLRPESNQKLGNRKDSLVKLILTEKPSIVKLLHARGEQRCEVVLATACICYAAGMCV